VVVGFGDEVVVTVGAGFAVEEVVVVGSLQPPNHPGDVQVVVVDVVDVEVDEVDVVLVVVSSRHPHHPGVLQVLVRVFVLDVELDLEEVVVSEPLLSKYFQLKQSTQSGSTLQEGTSSYSMMTSCITALILCTPIPTLHDLSPTVSYTHCCPVWHAVSIAYPPIVQMVVAPLQRPMKTGSAVCPKWNTPVFVLVWGADG
jgi:hypothetical protein